MAEAISYQYSESYQVFALPAKTNAAELYKAIAMATESYRTGFGDYPKDDQLTVEADEEYIKIIYRLGRD